MFFCCAINYRCFRACCAMNKTKKFLCIIVFIVYTNILFAEQYVGEFSSASLSGWQEKVFNKSTNYKLVSINGKYVLEAHSIGAASALYKYEDVLLNETPYMNWSWRILNAPELNYNERQKKGDDFAARIYAVKSKGFLGLNTKSIIYVWSSSETKGASWISPYTKNAVVLVLQSGFEGAGKWEFEKRNVKKDFKILFNMDVSILSGIAVMTDTDDSGTVSKSHYGDICFSSK